MPLYVISEITKSLPQYFHIEDGRVSSMLFATSFSNLADAKSCLSLIQK